MKSMNTITLTKKQEILSIVSQLLWNGQTVLITADREAMLRMILDVITSLDCEYSLHDNIVTIPGGMGFLIITDKDEDQQSDYNTTVIRG